MTTALPPPFPTRLRHRRDRPKPRLRVVVLALLPSLVLLVPGWRLQAVEIVPCPGLPDCVVQTAQNFVGSPAVLLDLEYFRRLAETWPQIRSVEVHFQLPGTLRLQARPSRPCASVEVAGFWHGVSKNGVLCGRTQALAKPALHGFDHRPQALRKALSVAARLEESSGWHATEVRHVLPGDLEIELSAPDNQGRTVTARVSHSATSSEHWWIEQIRKGRADWVRVDLRRDDRVVVGALP